MRCRGCRRRELHLAQQLPLPGVQGSNVEGLRGDGDAQPLRLSGRFQRNPHHRFRRRVCFRGKGQRTIIEIGIQLIAERLLYRLGYRHHAEQQAQE